MIHTLLNCLAGKEGEGFPGVGDEWQCVLVEREAFCQKLIEDRLAIYSTLPGPVSECQKPSLPLPSLHFSGLKLQKPGGGKGKRKSAEGQEEEQQGKKKRRKPSEEIEEEESDDDNRASPIEKLQ